jgi:hypothetical protein
MRPGRLASLIAAFLVIGCNAGSTSAFSATFDSASAAYADAGYVCTEPGGDNDRVSFSVTHCINHIEGADHGIILYGMADGMVGGVDIVGRGQFPLEWSEDEPLVLEALRPIVAPERLDPITETIRDRLPGASFGQPVDIGSGLQLRVDATGIYVWTPELAAEIDALFASPPAS